MDLCDPEIDFVALSLSMGIPTKRKTEAQEVVPGLRAAIASGVTNLLDISVADGFGASCNAHAAGESRPVRNPVPAASRRCGALALP